MQKTDYVTPKTEVVFVQIKSKILTESGVDAARRDYGTASGEYEQTWE